VTPEQLASARATHWREDAQPILTLDDAKAWLERMQLCLYLPRKTHVLAPAPSFVGAVLGQSSASPPPEAIQQAHDLLVRLVTEGFVVPLNLFGTPGEQPDFLVLTGTLPHLAALLPDRNWKKAPPRNGPGKVSPLAIEIWKLLEREGGLTATDPHPPRP
jgi:23S rRNA pseudouridine2605 synthase